MYNVVCQWKGGWCIMWFVNGKGLVYNLACQWKRCWCITWLVNRKGVGVCGLSMERRLVYNAFVNGKEAGVCGLSMEKGLVYNVVCQWKRGWCMSMEKGWYITWHVNGKGAGVQPGLSMEK